MTSCDISYDVRYGIRGSYAAVSEQTIQMIEYGRRLDDISSAKITHILTDPSCCADLGRLEPWSDTVEIRQNGDVVWFGWITAVEYSRSTVIVEAQDALAWSRVRVLNGGYDKKQDSALHFKDIWDSAMSPSPLPVDVITTNTGVVEKRTYSDSYKRISWFLLKELFEGSLDVTVLGNQIYAGPLWAGEMLHLNAEDFAGDIVLRKAGEYYANQVIVEGARGISGTYPTGTVRGDSIYPLVQDVVYDEAVTSAASAQSLAKSRYEYTQGIVPRVVRAGDALQLRQGAIDIRKLIPSRYVTLDTSDLCYSSTQQYRLGGVDVTFAGNVETIALSLQPLGTLANLEGISADDDRGATIDTGGGA